MRCRARAEGRSGYSPLSRELEQLRPQLYGRKSEKVNVAQQQLSLLPVLPALGRLQDGDVNAAADAEHRQPFSSRPNLVAPGQGSDSGVGAGTLTLDLTKAGESTT